MMQARSHSKLVAGAGLLAFSVMASPTFAAEPKALPQGDPAMRLIMTGDAVELVARDGVIAGRYNFTDSFKPHVHPLASPKGHVVSLASPHDHKHHKGLMYALRIPELNFWEEVASKPDEKVGRQRHIAFTDVRESGDEVGFTETLSWEAAEGSETDVVFDETRRLSCRREGTAFRWTWDTALKVRRATKLIQSQWSYKKPEGGLVNYHGLGLRFRREFGGGTRNNALQLDDAPEQWNKGGQKFDFATAMGATPQRATFVGAIDGFFPVPYVAVTLEQKQRNGLFVKEEPFAFFAMGPSNLEERPLAAGEVLNERYAVVVRDR